MPNYQEVSTKKANPLLPFLGFFMLVLIGGFSYLVSPMVADFLTTTNWSAGSTKILPIAFPAGWSTLMVNGAVTLGLSMILFAIAMILLFMVMGSPEGPTDVSLKEIRDEKKRKEKQRLGR